MRIVFVSAECAPFVKVGGLADVIGSLPPTLRRLGHEVCIVLPHHGVISDDRFAIKPYDSFEMAWNGEPVEVHVSVTLHKDVPVYFIRGYPFFNFFEDFVYSYDEGIDVGRFLFFCYATLMFVRRRAEQEGWHVDVFHANDWHTATLPYLLRKVFSKDEVLSRPATLFSIHNMQYQGWGVGWHLDQAFLPYVDHPLLHAMNYADNCLAIGLAYSTILSTVSERYAEEILSPEVGCGLDGLLEARRLHLKGILNGIDPDEWNPATSTAIAETYTVSSLERRSINKRVLQRELGLPERVDVPLLGTVIRLVEQKGADIIVPAVHFMLKQSDVQFALLGTGHPAYEAAIASIVGEFPQKAAARLTFDARLAERFYAGLDMFLMPSLFEPCGIGQMIAMRYGAIPIVRRVGGLADTVDHTVGFLFNEYSAGAFGWAINDALLEYHNQPTWWIARQIEAMKRDFSWASSASKYLAVYQKAVDIHRAYA